MSPLRIVFKLTFLLFFLSLLCAQSREELMGYHNSTFWGKEVVPHVILNRMISDSSLTVWNTGKHTASPTPIGAIGPEQYIREFNGIVQNTRIAEVLKQAVKDGVNVILVIGDGMGINQMTLPIYYNVASRKNTETYFERIMKDGRTGLLITNPYNEITTSSAAAATAIATGKKTLVGMLGLDHNGYNQISILDVAESENYATGLISDAPITDATPGAFFAHSTYRYRGDSIAVQLAEDNEIEVLLGGGASFFIPKDTRLSEHPGYENIPDVLDADSWRKDDRNLLNEMKQKGYTLAANAIELKNALPDNGKLLGLFSSYGLNAVIDRDDENTGEPSLVEMAAKGLDILSKNKNYFLMIEAARIDWESHDNDIGAVYKAVVEMDEVLAECYKQYKSDPENTLLVFTADHETGGLGITYSSLPREKRIPQKLEAGNKYTRRKNSLDFNNFLKIAKQSKSISRIFDESKSSEELYQQLKKHLPYEVSKEEAEILFPLLKNYEKYK